MNANSISTPTNPSTPRPNKDTDCVYYWQGGTQEGRWLKAVPSELDLQALRASIERMGCVWGNSSVGAPDGPPKCAWCRGEKHVACPWCSK